MSSQKTLLLDLDGMLIDMVVPLMRWWGIHISSDDQYPQQCGYDVKDAIACLLNQQGRMEGAKDVHNMPRDVFWCRPRRGFWQELQPYPTALSFIKFLERGPYDIYILTTHVSPDCAAAKLDWIDEHLPEYSDRVLVGHPKHLAANEHSILIDDCTKNCEDFTRAGGKAVQCPRPWNDRWDAPECFSSYLGRRKAYDVVIRDLYTIGSTT